MSTNVKQFRDSHRRAIRRACAIVAAASIALSAGAPAQAQDPSATQCREVSLPVTVNGMSGPISGTFCAAPAARSIQILVPGFTYNRSYWSFPYGHGQYSYAQHAADTGYATLSIDRLGTGASWRPLSPTVDYDGHVSSVHQVVQAVRSGVLGSRFDHVILVGHSLGSIIAYSEAGTHNDVDAIIVTGAAHTIDGVALATALAPILQPAMLDEKFADDNLDPGYLTTKPGTRTVFYREENASPDIIAMDEVLKDLGNLTEELTAAPYNNVGEVSQNINIPALTVLGEKDPFFCSDRALDCSSSAAVAAAEREHYGPRASVEAAVIPDTGHNLNLEYTRRQAWTSIDEFLVDYGLEPRKRAH